MQITFTVSYGGTVFEVDKIVKHPLYNSAITDFDYTLVKLKKTITFNDRQQPIKLASAGKAIADGTAVLTSGFGDTKQTLEQSEFLRSVIVKIVGHTACKTLYAVKPEYTITDNMLCGAVTGGGKDSCQGKYDIIS